MDVNDDDEYMNAAAAHAAFVMTVSAARMYWLMVITSCTARARQIFNSSTHFPKNRPGLCRFSAHWNRL